MDDLEIKLEIPADQDGFVLLQCPLCGEFFKLRVDECQAEDVYENWCPSCGLKSDNYLTDEVIELAMKKLKNIVTENFYNETKKQERKSKTGSFSVKAGKKPAKEDETPIVAGIEALEIQKYKCCNRSAKIKPGVKICGSFCPYCGVRYDGNE